MPLDNTQRANRGDTLIEQYRTFASEWETPSKDTIPMMVRDLLHYANELDLHGNPLDLVAAGVTQFANDVGGATAYCVTLSEDDYVNIAMVNVFADNPDQAASLAAIEYANTAPDRLYPKEILILAITTGAGINLAHHITSLPHSYKYMVTFKYKGGTDHLILHATGEADACERVMRQTGQGCDITHCQITDT